MKECPYCSSDHTKIYHNGLCPRIKSIEYDEKGSTTKIEFREIPEYDCFPITETEYAVRWLIS